MLRHYAGVRIKPEAQVNVLKDKCASCNIFNFFNLFSIFVFECSIKHENLQFCHLNQAELFAGDSHLNWNDLQ